MIKKHEYIIQFFFSPDNLCSKRVKIKAPKINIIELFSETIVGRFRAVPQKRIIVYTIDIYKIQPVEELVLIGSPWLK